MRSRGEKMGRWRDGVPSSPQRRYREYPSFSSTLLDAIYRSIDETDERGATNDHRASGRTDPYSARKKQTDASRRIPSVTQPEVTQSGPDEWSRRSLYSVNQPSVTRSGIGHWTAATSSSSDGSSYGGFSSSEADSVPSSLRLIRTSPTGSSAFPVRSDRNRPAGNPPPPPPLVVTGGDEKRVKKERLGSIRSRLLRELRKGRTPTSPGARLANFLNSLFAAKSKVSGDAVAAGEESACSSASSYSRSCLSKTPSSRGQSSSGKRTVSFCPISVIVDEDCRPCGQKCVYGIDRQSPTLPATVPLRRVAEMFRRSEVEEEEEGEEEDRESDSSSDLFELENLAIIDIERFGDELPVYETTQFASYSGISHGFVL